MTRIEGQVRTALAQREKQRIPLGDHWPAAVLLCIYPKQGEYIILFTVRTSRVEYHKGEISFPGGAKDPEDDSLIATALRESEEEIGIDLEDVEVLGELDDIETRSNFVIAPFVATFRRPPTFHPSEIEVEEILEVPVRVLLDPATLRDEPTEYGGRPVTGFYYLYGEHVIWGATARILRQFLDLMFNSDAQVLAELLA